MSFVKIGAHPPPSFADPIGVLTACHRKIEERLATLERASSVLAEKPDEALAAIEDAVSWLETAGARHTEDEDASFFPRLHGVDDLLSDLNAEHRAAEAILLSLRAVLAAVRTDPALAGELRTHMEALAASYRAHIADEEERLLPLARALPEDELRAVGLEMSLRRGGRPG